MIFTVQYFFLSLQTKNQETKEMRKVIGIGETVLDIIFRDNQPIGAYPGGSTFNAINHYNYNFKDDGCLELIYLA